MDKNKKDPRYRKYESQIERTLSSFEKEINEWADFITFLDKLLKTFKTYSDIPVIPRKLVVAKRLAQSMNPALPPGIHQRALEVYKNIFSIISTDQLADDLPIYSQGLFPFLQHAATKVKPSLLELFEKYYLPLGGRLRPVMKAFITALLPGLEEKGSESFDKVLSLLNALSACVELSYFLQSMWLAMITSPSLRGPALEYLSRRMPKIASREDVAMMLGDDAGIMVRAFAATLGDEKDLIKRELLQLLVEFFPLKNKNAGEVLDQDDLILLMKSAIAVVLRKEMSLNKRLYNWLLGPEDNEDRVQYFEEYGKAAAVAALKSCFFSKTKGLATAQQPYKMLISLMDKWEIGYPIVQELLIDVLVSLRSHVQNSEFGTDLLQTANMFLEMVPPYLIWMKLYALVMDHFPSNDGKDTEALDLVDFILTSLTLHEEEIQQIHLPMFLTALLCKAESLANSTDFTSYISQIESALRLALDLLKRIPRYVFQQSRHIQEPNGTFRSSTPRPPNSADQGDAQIAYFVHGTDAVKYVNDFYMYKTESANGTQFASINGIEFIGELLKAVQGFLERVITRCIICEGETIDPEAVSTILEQGCTLIREISEHFAINLHKQQSTIHEPTTNQIRMIKDSYSISSAWISALLKCCYKVDNFDIIDSSLSTIIDLITNETLLSPEILEPKHQTRLIVSKLWSFLSPDNLVYHCRSVELIWLLHKISPARYVESIISEYLIEKDTQQRTQSYERFGVFWKLSENHLDLSTEFQQPTFLMLDTLRDKTPANRRAGESWMRSNHLSYIKLISPILNILCDCEIQHYTSSSAQSDGENTTIFYQRPFSQAQVNYAFETLIAICKVGGSGFLKSLRNSVAIGRESDTVSKWSQEFFIVGTSYTNVLIKLAIRFIEAEFDEQSDEEQKRWNECIHMHATDFLNLLLTKPIDSDMLYFIHDKVLEKMLFCIEMNMLDLQARLLHVLHSTVMTSSAASTKTPNGSHGMPKRTLSESSQFLDSPLTASEDSKEKMTVSSPLFVKVIILALSRPSNRPLLQQWMDFILTSLPCFKGLFNTVLVPVMQCICEQLTRWNTDMNETYASAFVSLSKKTVKNSNGNASEDASEQLTSSHVTLSQTSDWDCVCLLNGLERIVMFCLTDNVGWDENDGINTPITPSGGGLSNIVTGVFGFDTPTEVVSSEHKPRDYVLFYVFPSIASIILDIWSLSKAYSFPRPSKIAVDPFHLSFLHMCDKVKASIRKLLEKLYKNQKPELLEAFVELWFINSSGIDGPEDQHSNEGTTAVVEVLRHIPSCTTQKVIITLLESARSRSSGLAIPRTKRPFAKSSRLSDVLILRFLETYCENLDQYDALVEVWPYCLAYSKDIISQANGYKYLFPSLMRFIHSVVDKLTTTSCFEDRKMRKDMQDNYQRVLENCIFIAGKSFDQGLWIRRSTRDEEETSESLDGSENKDSDFNRSSTPMLDEKKLSSRSKEEILIDKVNQHLASVIIPNIRRLIQDQAGINQMIYNMMYYVITPALKSRGSTSGNRVILDQLVEISKITFASKWRKEVWEFFMDNRFFNMGRNASKKWQTIVQTIMLSEKERFAEILGRISTSPANGLFMSKDQETLNRALNLRRLSYIIYSGKVDQYSLQLPSVQEKLVELLKLEQTELVHVEIYLCLRILLLRLSKKPLSTFWPIILTELVRLFGSFLQKIDDRPETANIFLAACKFLDLLFVLRNDDFQVYEWIFIRDTIDVINHSLEWSPYALMDRLGEKFEDGQHDNYHVPIHPNTSVISPSKGEFKRPMLTVKSIASIRQLSFFVRHISLYVYQSTYTLAKPDLAYIEHLLENDLLEGGDGEDGNALGVNQDA
ncbi:1615_t:CDS:10 [Paraglomus brasilianum]|uniref:1615_t:CDS:1 n=1 Tax=Paraglomus brasilianum TaxID=144538 RepID=A0A9N9F3S1_9GLOM|nr:1615_t:CDS:10 [Paraglomus brasilianum]